MSDRDRLVILIAAGLLVVISAVLPFVSIGDASDTPCGPLVDRNFPWDSGCSAGYRAVAGLVVWLPLTAVVLGAMVVTRKSSGLALWVLAVSGAAGLGASLVLMWVAWVEGDPVMERGWASARNLVGLATLTVVGLVAVVGAARQTTR